MFHILYTMFHILYTIQYGRMQRLGLHQYEMENKEKHYYRGHMPSKVECSDTTQQWVHNNGTGYMLKKLPFGGDSDTPDQSWKL